MEMLSKEARNFRKRLLFATTSLNEAGHKVPRTPIDRARALLGYDTALPWRTCNEGFKSPGKQMPRHHFILLARVRTVLAYHSEQ